MNLLINSNFAISSKFALILILLICSSQVFAFRLITNIGAAFDSEEVKIYITSNSSCLNAGGDPNELLDQAVNAAENFWNTVPTSNIKIIRGGILQTTDNSFITAELCTPDSTKTCLTGSTVTTDVSSIIIACNNNQLKNFTAPEIQAISGPVNISSKKIIGSIILINDALNSTVGTLSANELVSLLAHEIGHAVGIGHSNKEEAMMYYKSTEYISSLSQDDIDAITYLYPNEIENCNGLFGGTLSINLDNNDPSTPSSSMTLYSFKELKAILIFLFSLISGFLGLNLIMKYLPSGIKILKSS